LTLSEQRRLHFKYFKETPS